MKNTMIKILGVVLTLAVLAGLLLSAVPVSAGTLAWTDLPVPQLTVDTNANLFTIAADGKTMFLFTDGTVVQGVADAKTLYKSTDAGKTWSSTGIGTNVNGLTLTALDIDPTNASNLLATDSINLWRSTNGGVSFNKYNPAAGYGTINSIDLTTTSAGLTYLVGTSTGIGYYDPGQGTWTQTWDATFGAGWAGAANVAAFSPNFGTDGVIVGVSGNTTRTILLNSANSFNSDVPNVTISGLTLSGTSVYNLAFPSDWAPTAANDKLFVGYGSTGADSWATYRVAPFGSPATKATVLDSGTYNVASLAFKGTGATGTLAIGQVNSSGVLTVPNAGTVAPTAVVINPAAKSPTGTAAAPMTKVAFSPVAADATLYAGTAGANSELASSLDYVSFNGYAFVRVSAYSAVGWASSGPLSGAGAPIEYFTIKDTGPTPNIWMVFQSKDTGATWKEIFNNAGATNTDPVKVMASPAYATDKTIYLATAGPAVGTNQKSFYKSTDDGATWSLVYVAGGVAASAFAPIDGNNYWIGSAAGIRNNSSATTFSLNGDSPAALIAIPGFFYVGTFGGDTWVSLDGGATFLATGSKNIPATKPTDETFDAASKTIYKYDTSGNIQKYTVGTDVAWSIFSAAVPLPTGVATANVTILSKTPTFWYFGTPGVAAGQIWRSQDLMALSPILGSNNLGGTLIGFSAAANAAGNYVNNAQISLAAPGAPNNYPYRAENFIDTLSAAPTIAAPANKASVPDTVNFTWSGVNGATQYQIQIAYDSSFANIVKDTTSSGTILAQVPLTAGQQYYWRVRVTTPETSAWSDAVTFNTQLGSSGSANVPGIDTAGRIYPANGATNVSPTAPLTWGTVPGATSYEVKISTDPSFATTVDSASGLLNTAYVPKNLKAGTTYFWEVRAVNGTVTGDWVTSAFTTAGAGPAGTPAPATSAAPITIPAPTVVVTVPPQSAPNIVVTVPAATAVAPAPPTPAYIWVIIAIGAILVIAVIVLIARTRRV